jgi:hypothetical protein
VGLFTTVNQGKILSLFQNTLNRRPTESVKKMYCFTFSDFALPKRPRTKMALARRYESTQGIQYPNYKGHNIHSELSSVLLEYNWMSVTRSSPNKEIMHSQQRE